MKAFTVVWDDDAQAELARLWNHNPRIRGEVTFAADEIDRLLAIEPGTLGDATSARTREWVKPPLKVLFSISEPDRVVRVLYVKLWPD